MSATASTPEGRPGRRRSLATQVSLVTTGTTLVAVVLSFLVSAGLVRGAAEDEARRTLGRYALLVADGRISPADRRIGPASGLRALTRVAQVRAVRVYADGTTTGAPAVAEALPREVLTAAAAGTPVDVVARVQRRRSFVEGRPVEGGDGSVVLVQPRAAASALTGPLRRRSAYALLVGLLVAVAAGLGLAKRLARPLEQAAAGAVRLSRGEREVRVTTAGPAEVASVGAALNALAEALAVSEDRQRQFLLSVSHELRTPLTALAGYAEALADGVVPPQDVARVGATLRGETDRLSRLVSDLLDLARLGADDFRVEALHVDLTALVRAAGDVWRDRCAREGVLLRLEVPEGPLVARTDPGRLRQVVDNLAENALRVTPAGAVVVLALRPAPGAAVLEVRDGGPGLRDEDLPVAFDRSVLHDRYRGVRPVGTGLGLALVAGLAARLGGTASAGRAPEGGARFAVTLPLP